MAQNCTLEAWFNVRSVPADGRRARLYLGYTSIKRNGAETEEIKERLLPPVGNEDTDVLGQWQRGRLRIDPARPMRAVTVLLIHHGPGVVDWDDVELVCTLR